MKKVPIKPKYCQPVSNVLEGENPDNFFSVLQSTFSDYCGKFCIAFIKNVHDRHSYDDFIDQFDFVNLYKNDSIVENIYL